MSTPVPMPAMGELTAQADAGDVPARQQLFELLYDELHRMARRVLWKNNGGVTLSPTTLLHETFLAMHKAGDLVFPDKARFMAYAARAMRGLIIDRARERQALKRGSGFEFITLQTELDEVPEVQGLQALSDALEDLARVDAALTELVDLKFFCGMTFAEIAALRGVSERTVQRDWQKARLLLHDKLS